MRLEPFIVASELTHEVAGRGARIYLRVRKHRLPLVGYEQVMHVIRMLLFVR
jgi:hypothetical protein